MPGKESLLRALAQSRAVPIPARQCYQTLSCLQLFAPHADMHQPLARVRLAVAVPACMRLEGEQPGGDCLALFLALLKAMSTAVVVSLPPTRPHSLHSFAKWEPSISTCKHGTMVDVVATLDQSVCLPQVLQQAV